MLFNSLTLWISVSLQVCVTFSIQTNIVRFAVFCISSDCLLLLLTAYKTCSRVQICNTLLSCNQNVEILVIRYYLSDIMSHIIFVHTECLLMRRFKSVWTHSKMDNIMMVFAIRLQSASKALFPSVSTISEAKYTKVNTSWLQDFYQ